MDRRKRNSTGKHKPSRETAPAAHLQGACSCRSLGVVATCVSRATSTNMTYKLRMRKPWTSGGSSRFSSSPHLSARTSCAAMLGRWRNDEPMIAHSTVQHSACELSDALCRARRPYAPVGVVTRAPRHQTPTGSWRGRLCKAVALQLAAR